MRSKVLCMYVLLHSATCSLHAAAAQSTRDQSQEGRCEGGVNSRIDEGGASDHHQRQVETLLMELLDRVQRLSERAEHNLTQLEQREQQHIDNTTCLKLLQQQASLDQQRYDNTTKQ